VNNPGTGRHAPTVVPTKKGDIEGCFYQIPVNQASYCP
jgi:hypothetical protein